MQYNLSINVCKATEWGLDSQLACLFSYLLTVKLWVPPTRIGDQDWYWLAKSKILTEVPFLGDKPDTVYRQMKRLQEKGLINVNKNRGLKRTYIQITNKGLEWHHSGEECVSNIGSESEVTSDLNPKHIGSKSEGSVNHRSVNHRSVKTNVPSGDDTPSPEAKNSNTGDAYSSQFEQAWKAYPKRSGANNKKAAYKQWNARLKSGVTAERMIEGATRYSTQCKLDGNYGTAYVKQASTFFGPNEHYNDYDEPIAAPVTNNKITANHGLRDKDYDTKGDF